MPALSTNEAAERLAKVVETADPNTLGEIYSELFPTAPVPQSLVPGDLARHVRYGLEPEEIVDLWNVIFPEDRHVWYNEETEAVHYNEELVGYED